MQLHPAQKQIFHSKARFRVAVCGRRFGKTVVATQDMWGFALYKSGSKVVYVAPTIKQARDIAWVMLKEATRQAWAEDPNETRLEIKIRADGGGTSEIWLRGVENVETLRGIGIDFLVGDEIQSMSGWVTIWQEVLRPTLIDTRGSALFIGTPKGFNHFYDLYNMHLTDPNYESFCFSTYDNPHIDRAEIDMARDEAERTGTLDQFNQEFMAQFVSVSGQVYKEWEFTRQFIPAVYDPKLPLHITMDFGVNDPTVLIWIQRQGGEFRIIDYYESSNADVAHFIQVIRSKPYKEPEMITGDPAGKARSIVTNTSPIEEYQKSGIHIRTKDGVLIPEQIRITHKYMKSLYVDSKLTRLRDCILNYRYPEKKENAQDQSNEKPIHDEYSHAMRALEYYFVNIDTGISTSYKDVLKGFPKNDVFDKYGIPNI